MLLQICCTDRLPPQRHTRSYIPYLILPFATAVIYLRAATICSTHSMNMSAFGYYSSMTSSRCSAGIPTGKGGANPPSSGGGGSNVVCSGGLTRSGVLPQLASERRMLSGVTGPSRQESLRWPACLRDCHDLFKGACPAAQPTPCLCKQLQAYTPILLASKANVSKQD